MATCPDCGKKVLFATKFCPSCGSAMDGASGEHSSRKQVFEGKVHKCPSCGEVLNAFEMVCPSCGYELRDTKGSSAVKELAAKLEKIQSKDNAVFSGVSRLFNGGDLSKSEEQRINLIRNFVIPNNKEDIIEFMIMAVANINASAFNTLNSNNMSNAQKKSEKAISEAWIAKFEQASQKAKLSFPNDPAVLNAESAFQMKMKEVSKEKSKWMMLMLGMVGFLVLMLILLAFM